GFVNVVEMKARIYDGNKCQDAPIWEEKLPKVKSLNEMIMESVAETSEELLEKYLGGEEIPMDQIKHALHNSIINGELTTSLVGSSLKNIGMETMLKMLIDFAPSPDELKELEATNLQTNQKISVKTVNSQPF